jgi:segregation and condensation protein B
MKETEIKKEKIKQIIEAIIFTSKYTVKKEELFSFFKETDKSVIEDIIKDIKEYHELNSGLFLDDKGDRLTFKTKHDIFPYIKKFFGLKKELRFSKAALETLALIAYKQPITLKEISYFRGTQSSYMLKQLLEANLIKIQGRKKVPGHPLLYGTTDKFLEIFGLSAIDDLPSVEELQQLLKENDFSMEN